MTSLAATQDIIVDRASGGIENASVWEAALIRLVRAGHLVLRPLQNFGISRVAGFIGRGFAAGRHVRMRLNGDSWFCFPASDYYWPMLYSSWVSYEADIDECLQSLQPFDYVFVDCGANYGYWAILVTSASYGGKPAIAIEASPNTCRVLEQNAKINNERFQILQRALGSQSGQVALIYGGRHAGRTLLEDRAVSRSGERVETITVDDAIAGWMPDAFEGRIVVKLDIEGMEEAALSAAPRLMQSDALIIFEDAETDQVSAVVPLLLNDFGMRLFAYRDECFQECSSVEQVAAFKGRQRFGRQVGYNFFATRSPFWLERLANGKAVSRAAVAA